MKKIMALLTVLMFFASVSTFAQEVRGIETRRVVYIGSSYDYWIEGYHRDYKEQSTEWYGFEFKNLNSIAVSVDIELWRNWERKDTSLIATKSIVLQPGEKYIFKQENDHFFQVKYYDDDDEKIIDFYYVKYKAFKLQ